MVMSFFRRDDSVGLEAITARTVSMLADARHSFDLASTAVLSGADVRTVADDIRATDDRINRTEQQLRGELVVHVSVQGSDDIGEVLGFTLLIKKIERIGDQAKNILDLAEEGIDLSSAPDSGELTRIRRMISEMMGEAADFLSGTGAGDANEFRERTDTLGAELAAKISDCMHSELPGYEVVPRAILYRYWKRIIANVGGVVTTATEPLQHQGYLDDGQTDIDD